MIAQPAVKHTTPITLNFPWGKDSLKQLALTELRDSGINDSLIQTATEITLDIEFDPYSHDVSTPINDALNRRFTRFTQQAKANHAGIIFWNEDGTPWQVKSWIGLENNNGRSGIYLAPTGSGNIIYTPSLDPETLTKICDRQGLDLAKTQADIKASGSFWQWVLKTPSLPIIVTEGAKKSLAALSRGYIAIALYGCTCGKSEALKPYLAERKVTFAFDSDVKESAVKAVKKGLAIAHSSALSEGTTIHVASWKPSLGKGLDDLIVKSGATTLDGVIETAQLYPLWLATRSLKARKPKPTLTCNESDLSQSTLSQVIPDRGIVAIVSGTGTGKTKLISKISTGAALAPGHRISLQRGLSDRLGLTYIEDADRGAGYFLDKQHNPTLRIGFCWDSVLAIPLDRYPSGSFDLILDEADQGLKHLISGATCNHDGKRPILLQRALELIKRAKRVILASATLSKRELALVRAIRGEDDPVWILENTYQANRYPYTFCTGQRGVAGSQSLSLHSAIAAMVQAIEQGKPILVATDQRKMCKQIAVIGQSLGLSDAEILRFDQETSGNPDQQLFAENPDQFLAENKIKLLVHSPSLTSGVSIEGDHFDRVFGFFKGQTSSPDDCLQALHRYRKPVERIIYASHYGRSDSGGATSGKAYQKELETLSDFKQNAIGITANLLDSDDPFAIFHADTQADHNWAMRDFGSSLKSLLEDAGHIDSGNPIPESEAPIGKFWLSRATDLVERDRLDSLLNAPIISDTAATDLRKQRKLKHQDALQLERFDLCEFYHLAPDRLTTGDIKRDKQGKTRKRIARLEGLTWDGLTRKKDQRKVEIMSKWNAPIAQHDLPGDALFTRAMLNLGILDLLNHCLTETWCKHTDWVKKYTAIFRSNAQAVKLACNFTISDSISDVQIIGMILHSLGFNTKSNRLSFHGERVRTYRIDDESLTELKSVLQARAKSHTEQGFSARPHTVISQLLGGVDSTSDHGAKTIMEGIPIGQNQPPPNRIELPHHT
jgi:hypothetical protein